ncbi:hypothetical protein QK355_01445 [Pseudomonas aeruginosa]|uniref:hypothetical protein n=1 Tax=Pseudomonas aeruginosa TaxID=287 RepID=UPI0024A7C99C|nr:hypothetical protein [Pseudomonas aeruginosa]
MKVSKIIIALSAIFAVSANAAYSVKIYPEANIVFVNSNQVGSGSEEKPTTPDDSKLSCSDIREKIDDFAVNTALLLDIKYAEGDKCLILIKSVEKFGDKTNLTTFAQKIDAAKFENYVVSVTRYYKVETTNKINDTLISDATSYNDGVNKIWSQYVYDRMF